jgi:TetR/AcrR family transcriptional regulator, regulator of autoinduction and epiphytic fitness
MVTAELAGTAADGRRLRREQNREAVIDALLALFRDGIYQPSSAEIAARAGLSPRSLFRYFDDVDDLHRAAATRQILLALPLLELGASPQDPVAVKINAMVRARSCLYERTGAAARGLRACAHRHDVLAAQLASNRAFLRSQLSEFFAAELDGPGRVMLPALDILCSFDSYELLRRDQGLSMDGAQAAMAAAMSALLAGAGAGGSGMAIRAGASA